MSFAKYESLVLQWGTDRGIIQHGKPMGQAIKTLEEVTELLDAINKGDMDAVKDAVGDVVVTLLMVCATLDIDLTQCLAGAYAEIKDRRGTLLANGTFVKEVVA